MKIKSPLQITSELTKLYTEKRDAQLTLRVPRALKAQLEVKARKEGITKSDLGIFIIRTFLESEK